MPASAIERLLVDRCTGLSGTRFDDWRLLQGVCVEVWREGCKLRDGYVDTASVDSSMAWIRADGNDPRMLVEKCRGYELRISIDQWALRSLVAQWKG